MRLKSQKSEFRLLYNTSGLSYRDFIMASWLSKKLKLDIVKVFEPRFGHRLSDDEVVGIAQNLAGLMETIFRFEWRLKYGNKI